MTLRFEALFAVGRYGHPRSHGVVAVGLPQLPEPGPEKLGTKHDRRDHNAAFGAQ